MGLKALKKKKATKACGENQRICNPPLIVDKGARALRQAQGPGFSFSPVSELASGEPAEPVELPVKVRGREIFALRLHLP
jgi:hypothetical protein